MILALSNLAQDQICFVDHIADDIVRFIERMKGQFDEMRVCEILLTTADVAYEKAMLDYEIPKTTKRQKHTHKKEKWIDDHKKLFKLSGLTFKIDEWDDKKYGWPC